MSSSGTDHAQQLINAIQQQINTNNCPNCQVTSSAADVALSLTQPTLIYVPIGCDGVVGGGAVYDQCGVCDANTTNDNACFDCVSVPYGIAYYDNCSTCDHFPGNDCIQDCANVWGGNFAADSCGACDADATNDCSQDCAGTWGGSLTVDACGVCGGDGSGCAGCDNMPNSGLLLDVCGICGGAGLPNATQVGGVCACPPSAATLDNCGTCDSFPSNDCTPDCAGVWGGPRSLDQCNVCDPDPTNDCTQDCAGVWGGNNLPDHCFTCDSNPVNDCTFDCAGVWGGPLLRDQCGVCDAIPSNNCAQDCAGIWGGSNLADQCGTCDADPSNDCTMDCSGAWGGSLTLLCGVCGGTNTTCFGCDGVPNSGLQSDQCGTCDADTSNDCAQDCAGVWGGSSLTDQCGTCDADTSNDCAQDCANVWGGSSLTDQCGTCDAIPSNDCAQDCAGVWAGTSTVDQCGNCEPPTQQCIVAAQSDFSMVSTDVAVTISDIQHHTTIQISVVLPSYATSLTEVYGDSSQPISLPPAWHHPHGTHIGGPNSNLYRPVPALQFDSYLTAGPTSLATGSAGLNGNPALMAAMYAWTNTTGVSCSNNCRLYWSNPAGAHAAVSNSQVVVAQLTLPPSSQVAVAFSAKGSNVRGAGWGDTTQGQGRINFMFAYTSPAAFDCNNTRGGTALVDSCGACVAPGGGCAMDCAGVWGGAAVTDNCNSCDADASNDCQQDCVGTWGGAALVDPCGVCGGDGSSCADCFGVPNGPAAPDVCGVCNGGGSFDQCGVCNADAYDDCVQDCNNVWGGTATIDACGTCDGDGSGCAGCDNISNSGTVNDACGVCGGNGTSCADCLGVPNGAAIVDTCGTCTLTPCVHTVASDFTARTETYSTDGADTGWTTFRLRVDLPATSRNLYSVFGTSNSPLVMPAAWQLKNLHNQRGPPSAVSIVHAPTLEYSSYLCAGPNHTTAYAYQLQVDSGMAGALQAWDTDMTMPLDNSNNDLNAIGSLSWTSPDAADSEGITGLLVAQVTIATGTTATASACLKGRSVTGPDWGDADVGMPLVCKTWSMSSSGPGPVADCNNTLGGSWSIDRCERGVTVIYYVVRFD
jgi:hypothetical protein